VKLGPFAKLADVNYKTLANIESGCQRVASIEFVHRIAMHLPDTEAEDLLDVDGAAAA
jgi:DNA-binding XRE family transcriptional regulator